MDNYSTGKWALKSYTPYVNKEWVTSPPDKNYYLHIQGTNVLIINDGIVIKSLCLTEEGSRLNCKYRNQFIGISRNNEQKGLSKFKFEVAEDQTTGKSAIRNCHEIIRELKKFIPVSEYISQKGEEVVGQSNSELSSQAVSGVLQSNLSELTNSGEKLEKNFDMKRISQEIREVIKSNPSQLTNSGEKLEENFDLKSISQEIREVLQSNPSQLTNSDSIFPDDLIGPIIDLFIKHPAFPDFVATVGDLINQREGVNQNCESEE